jgi:hypothetical protein
VPNFGVYGQGAGVSTRLTVAQAGSSPGFGVPASVRQSAASITGTSAPFSHLNTEMLLISPPWLKLLCTRMSLLACTPLNLKPPPAATLPFETGFWKNQIPVCAEPL